ncbi:MAG TPA: undecaprenyl-diphosphate phosphatase, partial [Tepidisphaeraceae bacterium]
MIDLLRTVILGVVEGITEFLPVSSTGHMIICEKWMNIDLDEPFWKLFTVFIQIGAIFAVLVYFRGRIMTLLRGRPAEAVALTPLEASMSVKSEASGTAAHDAAVPLDYETPPVSRSPYWAIWMIIIATVPVLVVGLLTHKWIEAHLGSWMVVALSLGLGGIAMIVIELLPLPVTTEHIESMSLKQALGIGIAQILAAIFPGTSRSAATIMG